MHRLVKDRLAFRLEVLNRARDLFLEKGFEHTLMDDVARATGVSKPVIYEAFESKKLLFEAVYERALENLGTPWLRDVDQAGLSLSDYLDRICNKAKAALGESGKFDAVWLLIREGHNLPWLLPAFFARAWEPSAAFWNQVLTTAMDRGECRRMSIPAAMRLIVAPFFLMQFELSAGASFTLDTDALAEFLDEYFRSIKLGLQAA